MILTKSDGYFESTVRREDELVAVGKYSVTVLQELNPSSITGFVKVQNCGVKKKRERV